MEYSFDSYYANSASWHIAPDNSINANESRDVLPGVITQAWGNTTGAVTNPGVTGANWTSPSLTSAIMAQDATREYLYTPPNSSIIVTVGFGGAVFSTTPTVVVTLMTPDGNRQQVICAGVTGNTAAYGAFYNPAQGPSWYTPVAASVTASLPGGGYGSITLTASNCTALQYTITAATSGTLGLITFTGPKEPWTYMFPVSYNKEFDNSRVPFSSTRVGGVALRATNTTKLINKEGSILWGRFPMTKDPFTFNQTTLSALPECDKRLFGLTEGFYTYVAPGQEISRFVDYRLRTYPAIYDGTVPAFDLTSQSYCHAAIITDADSGTTFAASVATHLEFRSTSQLFPAKASTFPLEQLHQAVLKMDRVGFFFDTSEVGRLKALLSIGRAGNSGPKPQRGPQLPPPPPRGKQAAQPMRKRGRRGAKAEKPQPKRKGGIQMYLDSRKK
jgi:hypothetical protein